MGPHACNAEAVYGDVLDRASFVEAAAIIDKRFGCIHGLVNAAGGNKPTATTGPDRSFFDLPEDALRFVFDLNLMGTILPSQVFGRQMADCGEGVVLNFSSMNAFRPLTRVAAYSAAKAGVSNFTQWLAVHLAQNYGRQIRVNAVAPGFFLGEQNRFLLTDPETGELTRAGRASSTTRPWAASETPRTCWARSSGCSRPRPPSSRGSWCRWTAGSRHSAGCRAERIHKSAIVEG